MLVAALDEEAQDDLRANRNFGVYKGALFENVVAQMLVAQGYGLYFYRNAAGTLEMDFFVRDKNSLVPVEVKAENGTAKSLRLGWDVLHVPVRADVLAQTVAAGEK